MTIKSFGLQGVLHPARLNKEVSQFLDFADIIGYLRSDSNYLDEHHDDDDDDNDDDEFFCDIIDQRMRVQAYSQLGPLGTFDTRQEGSELAQNLCSDFDE